MAQSGTTWFPKVYEVNGQWSIQERDGQNFFVLEDDFFTSNGPDLKLYLLKLGADEFQDRDPVDREGVFFRRINFQIKVNKNIKFQVT